jgi:polyisoprenoid-binding protein YceI
MRAFLIPIALATLAACSPRPAGEPTGAAATPEVKATPAAAKAPREAPAGAYTMDPHHTSVVFRVPHMGISHYTARFTKADGKLTFDPANPAAQSVTATIDAGSVATEYHDADNLDFDAQIEKQFLDVAKYPQITFRSTKVEATGAETARVTGDLSLHGVTRPVVLEVAYNGGYKAGAMDPNHRIGFSGRGTFKRSDFGIAYGVPAPGSTFGVGDEVEVIIETEFLQPQG